MKVKECKNVAKLSDHFTSEELMKEFCGENWWPHGNKQYLITKIIAAIEEWILIIPPDALSTTLTTRDARILLLEVDTDTLRRYSPTGYTIKGSRIYNNKNCDDRILEKKEAAEKINIIRVKEEEAEPYIRTKSITRDDRSALQSAIRKAIEVRYNVNIGYHANCSHENYILFCKRLCNWPDIKRVIRKWKKQKEYVQDIIWIKKIWDCPEIAMKF